jgi:hypothetical protein
VGAEEQRRRFLAFHERNTRRGKSTEEPADEQPHEEYDGEGRVNPLELARRLRLVLEEGSHAPRRNLRPNMCYYCDTPAEELTAAQANFMDTKGAHKRHLW